MTHLWTIEGFESLTEQEVFDKSVGHVLKNGKPSRDGNRCQYGGIGCGAAPFLKPNCRRFADHSKDSDGDIVSLSWPSMVGAGKVPKKHYALIYSLQEAHDDASMSYNFMEEYRVNAERVAESYRLSPAILEPAHLSAAP